MAKGGGAGAADAGDGADEYYLCLPGRGAHATAGRRRAAASLSTSRPPSRDAAILRRRGGHCTCRSFFQNIKGASGGAGGGGATAASAREGGAADGPATCKHLLAAMLMPHVLPWSTMTGGGGGAEIEIVDDREFARLVARASIG